MLEGAETVSFSGVCFGSFCFFLAIAELRGRNRKNKFRAETLKSFESEGRREEKGDAYYHFKYYLFSRDR
jgi:hypothetical protein